MTNEPRNPPRQAAPAASAPASEREQSRPDRELVTDKRSQARTEQAVQPEPAAVDGEDGGGSEVTEKMNEGLSKGYVGIRIDTTPQKNYSVEGVTSGAPRPDAQPEPLSPDEAPNA